VGFRETPTLCNSFSWRLTLISSVGRKHWHDNHLAFIELFDFRMARQGVRKIICRQHLARLRGELKGRTTYWTIKSNDRAT